MLIKRHFFACLLFHILLLSSLYSYSEDYSRPAGLIKIEIKPSEEKLSSTPFEAFDANLNILLSGQLTGAATPENADQIKTWDSSAQSFGSAFLADGTGDQEKDGKWFKDNINWEPSDMLLSPGIGFIIKNSQLMAQSLFLTGRLPLYDSKILTLQPNLNLFSYPFASKISLNSTCLKKDGAKGGLDQTDSPDLIFTYSSDTKPWLMENPSDPNDGKWHEESGEISAFLLKPGSSYWYQRHGLTSFQWIENRPYQNLFNLNSSTPSITNMIFNPAHDEVTLHIDCTGEPDETLEIFFKDMGCDDSLSTDSGWFLAAQDMFTYGNTQAFWTDSGRTDAVHPFANRCKINNTFIRMFIVSRQDIDSDNDGIPNGREKFVYDTNPENPDTDGDNLQDDLEIIMYHTNPKSADSDGDGFNDFQEISIYQTDPNNAANNPAVMPSDWTDADIGTPGEVGSATYFNETFTVKGAGADIHGLSDKFNYLYQDLYGDCTVIARVANQQNTNALAKAGIMIRENMNADSRNVFAFITPGIGGTEKCYYQERMTTGKTSTRSRAYDSSIAYPFWLKLVKTGNIYSSYMSADGSTWLPMYINRKVAAGNSVKVGFAVTSMNNTSTSTSGFDNFSITRTLTETPAITPNGGYFQMNQQIMLSTSVPDSQIRYTLDSNDPTEISPLYTFPLTVDTNAIIKARLFKTGYNPGPTATAIFNQPGLMVKYYHGSWTTLPDFSTLIPYKVSMIPNIDYPDNYGHIMTSGLFDNVGAVITGQINCPVQGAYIFYLSSGEGAVLYVDGKRLIDSPKLRRFAQTVSPAISLSAGLHDICVEYFEATGSGGLQLKWSYPGQSTSIIIPNGNFFSQDTDADGLPDQWETYKFGNLDHLGTEDTDGDGISDKEELNLYFSDPSDSDQPFVETNPTDIANQIATSYCAKNNKTWIYVPDLDKLPRYFTDNGLQSQIKYPLGTGAFASSGTKTNVAAQFFGFIDITANGLYKFYLNCDDGANLYIDSKKIVDNDGLHTMREAYGFASLKSGKHKIKIDYYQTISSNGLVFSYEGPGLQKQIVPESALSHSPVKLTEMMENQDSDSDGLTDTYETENGTNPNDWDSVNSKNTISDGDRIATGTATGVLPAGWTDADIGITGVAGSANYEPPTFTVRGAGTDIYGTSDSFNYCYQELQGDCEIIVRLADQSNINAWTKAGIMIRESLAADSRNAFAFLTPSNGVNFQYRGRTAASTTRIAKSPATTPYWLKLVKTGDKYNSWHSKDGSIWVPTNTAAVSIPLGNAVKIGLAVTSMNNSINSVANFDNFSITRTISDTPAISPNGGYFQINQQVTLSTPVPDSQIRFTLDGGEPTEMSALYTDSFTIDANRTVKARIFKIGYNPGPTATAIFNQPGLMIKYFEGSWTSLPDFSMLNPYKISMLPNIDYPDNHGHIMTSGLCDNVGAVITGQIRCPVQGSYRFYLSSGEGAALYIDGKRIICSPKLRTFAQTASPALTLAEGFHDIKVEYFEASGAGGIQLKWSYPGQSAVIIPADNSFSPDTDADGLPDQWEIYKFGNLDHIGTEDTDGDGFSDKEELNFFFTDPSNPASMPSENINPTDISNQIAVTYCAKNNRIWTSVPDFDLLPHYEATSVNQINYPASTAKFATSGTATNVATQFTGFIDIPADGLYKFYISCDDGANLYIDNQKIVDNDGLHTMRETYGFASLKAGKHDIRVDYYQTTSRNGLILSYEGPGLPKQIVPSSALFHSPQFLLDMIASNDPDSDGINTIIASTGENGTIAPSGAVQLEYGASKTFTITPDANYRISDVLVDGISIGAVENYQFTNVKAPHTISANFAPATHNVIFDLISKGTRTGGGELIQAVNHGNSAIEPTITPNEGWLFTGWDKSFDNITADTSITAQYSRVTCAVTFIEGENGTISGTTVQTVNYGDSTEAVTAVPNTGYHFLNWTGDLTATDNPLTISNVTSNMTITANFAIDIPYTVTFVEGANGTITGSKVQIVNHGDSCEAVTAVPSTGYRFANWTGTGGFPTTSDNPLTVSNVISDMTITANFVRNIGLLVSDNPLHINEGEAAACAVTLSESPADAVTVTISFDSGYDGIALTSPSQLTFTTDNWNQPQTIQFSCANDNDAVSETTAFKIDSGICGITKLYLVENDKDVVISINADNKGSVSPSGRIPKRIGDVLTVTASPEANFLFDHWEGEVPEDRIHDNPVTLTIEKPCTVTAIFSNNYRALLKVNDVPSEWITVSPAAGNPIFHYTEELQIRKLTSMILI
jgi:hypothetical protein